MSKLKLITTETFETVPCDFYRDMNDEILLTRSQIGQALEYKNPQKAIDNIHKKHKDRLDQLSVTHKLRATDGKYYETILYTERGIMEICRWSRQKLANDFMDWVWDIIEAYRNNNLQQQINLQPLVNTITTLTETIVTIQKDINELKESSRSNYFRNKYPSSFYMRMKDKYKMLEEFYGCSRSKLYSEIYRELENTYDIDLNQIHEDYCYENRINKNDCYIMEAIEHNPQLRDALELLVNTALVDNNLQTEEEIKTRKIETIFSKRKTS